MTIRSVSLTAALCLSAPALLLAQPPAGAPPAGGPPGGGRPPSAPKNLQVLPADTNIRATMQGFEQALGVECEFCHAQNPDTHRNDFPSDANPMKTTARAKIRMNQDQNAKYLAHLPMPASHAVDAPPKIACGTCHRGQQEPPAFVPAPRQPGNGPGAPGGAAPGGAAAPAMPPGR